MKPEFNEKNEQIEKIKLRYLKEEEKSLQDSFNFVAYFTIVSGFLTLLSASTLFVREYLQYEILALLASSASLTWGIKNYICLDKSVKETEDLIDKAQEDMAEIAYNKKLKLLKEKELEKIEDLKKLEEEKQKKASIYSVSEFINPELFLEWVNFAYKLIQKEPRIFYNLIKNFEKIVKGEEIRDEYFTFEGHIYSVSSILNRFIMNSKEDKMNLYTPLEANTSSNLIVKPALEMEFDNLLAMISSDNLFITNLKTNLQRASVGDFENIKSMYILINQKIYSLIDLVIYFSPRGSELNEYWQNKEQRRINGLYLRKNN